ncbi:MAG: TetR/AcrR family transcriptional regulator [Williamsia sp.]|nr:TetR/AcrR family transcriptional regulator [Williamsia sp.]
MGIAERKIRQKESVRCSILGEARKIVEQEGWQALSIRRIAEAIEYSVPVIYDHFANKEAIMLEFTREGYGLLVEELTKAKDQHPDPAAQIEAMAYAYWEFAFNNKAYYQLMYGLGMPSCDTVRQINELQAFSELIQAPITQLLSRSSKPDTNPFLKLHTFWSMLHGLVSINMMSGTTGGNEALNRQIIRDFIEGFTGSLRT